MEKHEKCRRPRTASTILQCCRNKIHFSPCATIKIANALTLSLSVPQPIIYNMKISHPPFYAGAGKKKKNKNSFSSYSLLKHHPFPCNSCPAQACLAPIPQYPFPAFSPYSHHLLRSASSPQSCCYQPSRNSDKVPALQLFCF